MNGSGPALEVTLDSEHDGDLRVVGSRQAVAKREGHGAGDAVRSGNGAGNAKRSGAGTGSAVRDGQGDGHADRQGSGNGNAVRNGDGEGSATRAGHGDGDAVVSTTASGHAFRTDQGNGSAIRVGVGKGSAERLGNGTGHALHTGESYGNAINESTGKGEAIQTGYGRAERRMNRKEMSVIQDLKGVDTATADEIRKLEQKHGLQTQGKTERSPPNRPGSEGARRRAPSSPRPQQQEQRPRRPGTLTRPPATKRRNSDPGRALRGKDDQDPHRTSRRQLDEGSKRAGRCSVAVPIGRGNRDSERAQTRGHSADAGSSPERDPRDPGAEPALRRGTTGVHVAVSKTESPERRGRRGGRRRSLRQPLMELRPSEPQRARVPPRGTQGARENTRIQGGPARGDAPALTDGRELGKQPAPHAGMNRNRAQRPRHTKRLQAAPRMRG